MGTQKPQNFRISLSRRVERPPQKRLLEPTVARQIAPGNHLGHKPEMDGSINPKNKTPDAHEQRAGGEGEEGLLVGAGRDLRVALHCCKIIGLRFCNPPHCRILRPLDGTYRYVNVLQSAVVHGPERMIFVPIRKKGAASAE